MQKSSTAELRKKEIINLCDGCRLGYACDFEFDICDGQILAIIIGGSGGFFGFCKDDDIVIPWHKVECIGDDTILVRLTPTDLDCCHIPRKKPKKGSIL